MHVVRFFNQLLAGLIPSWLQNALVPPITRHSSFRRLASTTRHPSLQNFNFVICRSKLRQRFDEMLFFLQPRLESFVFGFEVRAFNVGLFQLACKVEGSVRCRNRNKKRETDLSKRELRVRVRLRAVRRPTHGLLVPSESKCRALMGVCASLGFLSALRSSKSSMEAGQRENG
jgi:hypothetical protein